jgi:hypothetical protein
MRLSEEDAHAEDFDYHCDFMRVCYCCNHRGPAVGLSHRQYLRISRMDCIFQLVSTRLLCRMELVRSEIWPFEATAIFTCGWRILSRANFCCMRLFRCKNVNEVSGIRDQPISLESFPLP